MNLFDEHADRLPQLGFRLARLEVYNWGTFDGEVWTLDLDGATSLLTGDVGSGKSTLVDAIITLLVPPRRITYNKAADASAKERSLNSYVRGYYAHHATAEGTSRPEALRSKREYSVILGVFTDENFGRTVTLAQVFWYRSESAQTPSRLYVLAEKPLSIAERFSRLGGDMRAFRRRLEADDFIHTYEDYPLYGRDFRKLFGIRQEQALDIFQQTISLKKVDSLTDFVRLNMLEPPDVEGLLTGLLHQFRDLEAAHASVVRAREQQQLLLPVRQTGARYRQLRSERETYERMGALLPAWLAERDIAALSPQIDAAEQKRQALAELLTSLRGEQQAVEQSLADVRSQLARTGGARLAALEGKRAALEEKRAARQAAAARYAESAAVLSLSVPETAQAFAANEEAARTAAEEAETALEQAEEDRADQQANLREVEERLARLTEEIASLSARKSNIPAAFVRLRGELADALDLAETELPFAGELMEVRAEEGAWEGALERLLHGFALSLLVPAAHYGEVVDWMEHHRLGTRLIYYSAEDALPLADVSALPEDAACRKLAVRHESPLAGWLTQELARRFRHRCCETLRAFRAEDYALTPSGQIKVGGRRHEKDDRHDIGDRRQYVLGFSSLRKVQALKQEAEDQTQERADTKALLRRLKKQRQEARARSEAGGRLCAFHSFEEIDAESVAQAIAACQKEAASLAQENEAGERLRAEQQRLLGRLGDLRRTVQEKERLLSRQELVLEQLERDRAADQEELARTDALALAKAEALLQAHAQEAWGARTYAHGERQSLESSYQSWLGSRRRETTRLLEEETSRLAAAMEAFNHSFPELARDLLPRPEAQEEYEELLTQLERDGLPQYERRFRALLEENTINQMALFYANLKLRAQEIKERIESINASLRTIDYDPGRCIEISCVHTHVRAVQEFRRALDACMAATPGAMQDGGKVVSPGAAASDEEGAGASRTSAEDGGEQQYAQVAALASRLRADTEEDKRWRREVVDVRNWFDFAASERWRETGEEYEHFTDSGGKSGGQKEKLAYTILAASIVYNFGLEGSHAGEQSLRFVVIDEAFLKSSDASARFGLQLFQQLDLQLLVVTPLLKIATIEPFVRHVGFVWQDDVQHRSYLRNISIEEFAAAREKRGE